MSSDPLKHEDIDIETEPDGMKFSDKKVEDSGTTKTDAHDDNHMHKGIHIQHYDKNGVYHEAAWSKENKI